MRCVLKEQQAREVQRRRRDGGSAPGDYSRTRRGEGRKDEGEELVRSVGSMQKSKWEEEGLESEEEGQVLLGAV